MSIKTRAPTDGSPQWFLGVGLDTHRRGVGIQAFVLACLRPYKSFRDEHSNAAAAHELPVSTSKINDVEMWGRNVKRTSMHMLHA